MGLAGHVARMVERRGVHTGLWWWKLREVHFEDTGAEKEDNIKMDLQEVE